MNFSYLFFFSVFWDLYSAAPERREQHPHSEEAKAFHDYVNLFLFDTESTFQDDFYFLGLY